MTVACQCKCRDDCSSFNTTCTQLQKRMRKCMMEKDFDVAWSSQRLGNIGYALKRSCCKCTPADVCGVFSNAVCLAQSYHAILSTGGFVHMSAAAGTASLALHTEPVPKRVTASGSCCKCTPADVCNYRSQKDRGCTLGHFPQPLRCRCGTLGIDNCV